MIGIYAFVQVSLFLEKRELVQACCCYAKLQAGGVCKRVALNVLGCSNISVLPQNEMRMIIREFKLAMTKGIMSSIAVKPVRTLV